jgi:hypothetical protein
MTQQQTDQPNTRPLVAYSRCFGLLPCIVVGTNSSHLLVLVHGVEIPTPRDLIFELQPGWQLNRHGRITPADGVDFPAGHEPPALLPYHPGPEADERHEED